MKTIFVQVIAGLLIFMHSFTSKAQISDTIAFGKRNVIKYNLSSALLWGFDNFSVEYERIVKPNQSFSILVGHRTFPKLINSDSSIIVREHQNKFGFNISGDYRFYLKSKNRNPGPDGVYVGPFLYYYNTGFTNKINAIAGEALQTPVEINSSLRIAGAGIELGYQFIIKKRFSVDLVLLGPSISFYRGKMSFIGDLNFDEENEYYQALRDLILSKYPYLEGFLEDKEIDARGTLGTLSFGFNYSIRVGYAF